jgi:hypothetical protein
MNPESFRSSSLPIGPVCDEDRRRRHTRHKLHGRVHVTLDQDRDGLLRDLSDYGLALQAVAVLRIHQHVHLRFELINPRTRVEAVGQVVWTNRSGEAGIEFTQISKRTQRRLKDWLLMNVLATASYVSSTSGIFQAPQRSAQIDGLIFSELPRPRIQASVRLKSGSLPSFEQLCEASAAPLRQFSCSPPPSANALSRAIDAVILLASALLFVGTVLSFTQLRFSHLGSLGLAIGSVVPSSALYWLMFVVCGRGTPGSCLVRIAVGRATRKSEQTETRSCEHRET